MFDNGEATTRAAASSMVERSDLVAGKPVFMRLVFGSDLIAAGLIVSWSPLVFRCALMGVIGLIRLGVPVLVVGGNGVLNAGTGRFERGIVALLGKITGSGDDDGGSEFTGSGTSSNAIISSLAPPSCRFSTLLSNGVSDNSGGRGL